MKKGLTKKKKIIIGIIAGLVLIGIFGQLTESGSKTDNSADETKREAVAEQEAEEQAEEEDKATFPNENAEDAWTAVDTYCREVKEWSVSDYDINRVEVDGNNYSVYVNRDMVDGSTGVFLFVLTPSKTASDGTIMQWSHEDKGQVFE